MRLMVLTLLIGITTSNCTSTITTTKAPNVSISNKTTADINGIIHNNGQPLANIVIEVMLGNCFRSSIKTIKSDKNGRYSITNLDPEKIIYIGLNGFSQYANDTDYLSTCDDHGVRLKAGETIEYKVNLLKKVG